MVTITVSIVSVASPTSPSAFLQALKASELTPVAIARVVQWIITPTRADYLTAHNWDFMIILDSTSTALPLALTSLCSDVYTARIQESATFAETFKTLNTGRLFPKPEEIPALANLPHKPLLATSTQNVELTPSLLAFSTSSFCPTGPVSMLNFMSFHPFPSARTSYGDYIRAFTSSVGKEKGGIVKMLGEVEDKGEWDEVALAQYSSLGHFADMMSDPKYQEVNRRLRLPALRDTCILMTTEVELGWGG